MNESLKTLFATPFCPNCATLYRPEHYDDIEDRACCPNCGTTYQIADEHRPPHPEDAGEYAVESKAESAALAEVRAKIERLAGEIFRTNTGPAYELLAVAFSDACDPLIEALDPARQPAAIAVAKHYDYIENLDDRAFEFGPGVCTRTGIDEFCCPCGYHE